MDVITIFGAYIGLGSNLLDKKKNILLAMEKIEEKGIEVLLRSDLYESTPYGVLEQPPFLNAVIGINSEYKPCELLKVLTEVEICMGRERTVRWGPRVIDLDIILFGDLTFQSDILTIPHKDFRNRDFVLRPLTDIGRMIKDPVSGRTIEELFRDLPADSCRKIEW